MHEQQTPSEQHQHVDPEGRQLARTDEEIARELGIETPAQLACRAELGGAMIRGGR